MKACALKFVKLYTVKCGRASALEKGTFKRGLSLSFLAHETRRPKAV